MKFKLIAQLKGEPLGKVVLDFDSTYSRLMTTSTNPDGGN